jgi:branched-chain amino acid transport system permease protein
MRVKLTAFVLSGFVTGIVGGLYVLFIGEVVPPGGFNPAYDLSIALMAFLGGFGTLWGPVLGALILEPLQQELTQRFTNGYASLIVLGCLFLLVILFLPRGLIPTGKEWADGLRAWWQRRGEPAPAAPQAGALEVPTGGAVGAAAAAKGSDVSGAGGTR